MELSRGNAWLRGEVGGEMTFDPNRCKASVAYGGRRVGFHQCSRKARFDGWCRQHHPDSVAERREQNKIRHQQKWLGSPLGLLQKAREEIMRLKARIAELEAGMK